MSFKTKSFNSTYKSSTQRSHFYTHLVLKSVIYVQKYTKVSKKSPKSYIKSKDFLLIYIRFFFSTN